MPDPVEVAIPLALQAHLRTFAEAQSPQIPVAWPDADFNPPAPVTKASRYFRVSYFPLETIRIISGPDTHSGLMQVDVFQGTGAGEATSGRVAAALIAHFKNRSLSRDGFVIEIKRRLPYRAEMNTDKPWTFIPVRIPYHCYAK
jgi:hypothetical protein